MKRIAEVEGEVVTGGLPDDILERLEARIAENRFLDPRHRYRVVDRKPRVETAYRTADVARRTLLAVETGLLPMHVELEVVGPNVRYAVRSPARRVLPFALFSGAFCALISLFAIAFKNTSGLETLSVVLALSFVTLTILAIKSLSAFRKTMNIEPSLSRMLHDESAAHTRVDVAPQVRVAEEDESSSAESREEDTKRLA